MMRREGGKRFRTCSFIHARQHARALTDRTSQGQIELSIIVHETSMMTSDIPKFMRIRII